jgi:dihydrofolate reductase
LVYAGGSKVEWDVTMSLDGFIADPNDNPGRIFDWYFGGDTPSDFGGLIDFKFSRDDKKYFDEGVKTVGAIIAGRRTYDHTKGWDGSFFIPVPFFVLTHKTPSNVPEGQTKFTFVTDGIESAIKQAKAAANGKSVGLMGASVARQCIEKGLLDELRIHLAPFLLGDGVRLFSVKDSKTIELKRTSVIESSSGWTHLHFKFVK